MDPIIKVEHINGQKVIWTNAETLVLDPKHGVLSVNGVYLDWMREGMQGEPPYSSGVRFGHGLNYLHLFLKMQTISLDSGKESLVVHVDGENGRIEVNVEGVSPKGDSAYSVAVNAIASLVLAHACAGIDIENKSYASSVSDVISRLADELA